MKKIKYKIKTRDVFFTRLEDAKKNVIKKVILNRNTVTGDRSYTDKISNLVAETNTHFQLIVESSVVGKKLFLCAKSEYSYETIKVF